MAKAKLKAKGKAAKKPLGLIQKSRGVSPASKALWNHGPGGKKVYRKFFGLSEKEQSDLTTFVGRKIDVNLSTTA
jgi:hypothetical protein